MSIDAMLAERGTTYGEYPVGAKIAMDLFDVAQASPSYRKMTAAQQYAVFMILAKLSRALNGDPNYIDSWRDASSYARLVADDLAAKEGSTDSKVTKTVFRYGGWRDA